MSEETHSITYGSSKITFHVKRRARKSLAIEVQPDMRVVVTAPLDLPLDQIMGKVKQRARWIMGQIHYFEQFQPKTPERLYLSGETHLFLGRQYRLRVEESARQGVTLTPKFLVVQSRRPTESEVTRSLVDAWFLEQAKAVFHERLDHCMNLFAEPKAVEPTRVIIRHLTNRWGSMTPAGGLVLNRRLVQAPVPCIDYVIVHELCHRIHPHHGPGFWQLLDRVMPNWNQLKTRLEQVMA